MNVAQGMLLLVIQGRRAEVPTEEAGEAGVERQARRRWPELGPCTVAGSLGVGPGQGSWQRDGRKPEAMASSFPILETAPHPPRPTHLAPRGAQPLHHKFLVSDS